MTLKLPELKRLWIWSHSVTVDSTPFLELNLLLKIYCVKTCSIYNVVQMSDEILRVLHCSNILI